jgi:hypothetical protein
MLKNVTELIDGLVNLVSGGLATLLMTVAFIIFLLAVINFIMKRRAGTNGEGLKQAGNMLFGSVFGLFVMVAVWGIVNFIGSNILGSDFNKKTIEKPQTKWIINTTTQ